MRNFWTITGGIQEGNRDAMSPTKNTSIDYKVKFKVVVGGGGRQLAVTFSR